MPSIKIRCSTCFCEFATQRSLKKHAENKGHQLNELKFYKQGETEPIILPKSERISQVQHAGYLVFLTGLAELINSFLKPDVTSKWAKIDLIMVPTDISKQLLLDLGLNKPFSAREARHPPPLKKDISIALHYNLYDIATLVDLFNQTAVPLKEKAYFRHSEEIQAPAFTGLTAQDKIALARQRAGSRWGTTSTDQIKKPTSRRLLKCEEGEWPRTREFQLIWWPSVYSQANFGHLRLRFFVEHIELIK